MPEAREQLRVVEVGDGPERQSTADPVADVKAADGSLFRRAPIRRRAIGLDEDVDRVLAALIHERRGGAAIEVKTPPNG